MESPQFVNHYSTLFSVMRGSGLATPWIKKSDSIVRRLPYIIWDALLTFIIIYMMSCYVYTLTTISVSIQDLCDMGLSTASYLYGLALTIYHWLFSARLKKITNRMDAISSSINKTDLGRDNFHHRMFLDNAKFMDLLTKVAFRYSVFAPFAYYLAVPVVGLMTGTYRSRFPVNINSPFDDKKPGVYEVVFVLLAGCASSSYAKKTATDCLFVTLFKIQTDFLKYLSTSMTDIQKEFHNGDPLVVRKKLVSWIKLHQKVVENVQDLILIFSPVVIIYYVSMIGNIVCAAFIIIKKDNDSLFQTALMVLYITVALSYQFLISNTVGQLTIQAQELSYVTYSLPWYKLHKENAKTIRLIISMCNRSIEVTAYRSPVFLLNRETFAGFVASAMSAFITLCQMKDQYDE